MQDRVPTKIVVTIAAGGEKKINATGDKNGAIPKPTILWVMTPSRVKSMIIRISVIALKYF
jgi:hypothetical protein